MSIIRRVPRTIKPPAGQARLKRGHPQTQGLVGWWLMNEGGGLKAYDLSGKGRHGVLDGAPAWVSGLKGSALNFDGANTQVYTDITDVGTDGLTVSAWANPVDAAALGAIVGKWADASFQDTFILGVSGSKLFAIVWNAGTYVNFETPAASISSNTWYFTTLTYDNSYAKLFINGIEAASSALSGPIRSSTSIVRIGQSGLAIGSPYHRFNGRIDDARIYNRALSAREVQSLYSDPLAALESLPIFIWAPSAGGATTYSYSGSGSLAFSGVASVDKVKNYSASGSIVFSSSASVAKIKNYTPSGSLVFSGAASSNKIKAFLASGNIVFSGAATTAYVVTGAVTYSYSGSGSLAFSGAASLDKIKSYLASGTIVFSGGALVSKVKNYATSGNVVFSGAAVTSYTTYGTMTLTAGDLAAIAALIAANNCLTLPQFIALK